MEIRKLELEIDSLGQRTINFDVLISGAGNLLDRYAALNQEVLANKCWVYQTIAYIHKIYNQAFNLLKSKKYIEGWNLLERVEIEIGFLKRHLHLVAKNYRINFIDANVAKLQSLFPYQLFASSEFISKDVICNVCGKKVTVRSPCGHLPGELYMGTMCTRTVTESVMLGLALVQNPVNKYSVIFEQSEDAKIRDTQQFGNLNYILGFLKAPYDVWSLEISTKLFPHTNYHELKPDDYCPCREGKLYKDCCILKEGIQGFHYQLGLNKSALAKAKKAKSKSKYYK